MVETQRKKQGCLYIVPTPIGNLADMVPRAIDVLQTVDLIAAEDTRHSGKLMQHFQITTPMTAYHDHSDEKKVHALLERLAQGCDIALISDAGTPLISDPGYRLVAAARQQGFKIVPIPGACAAIAALSASGLPSDRFSFEGFSPAKKAARRALFKSLSGVTRSQIFYESPHRIVGCLEDMVECFGDDRQVVLARELSKTFETIISGPVVDILQTVKADSNHQRGELVVLVSGFVAKSEAAEEIGDQVKKLMRLLHRQQIPLKAIAAVAAEMFDEKKNRLYRWGLEHLPE